ncbi:MAG TPA: ShlB/FhaC/HecB family hemolysin secretion/activation protein [Candidatus Omnitrophica bacterium]|nr:ShlB/FhaC/HecB family hemolysin secretion/activation protein [Candidatus Omnitrophota bacterium]
MMWKKIVYGFILAVFLFIVYSQFLPAQDEDSNKRETLEKMLREELKKPAPLRIKEKITGIIPRPVLPEEEFVVKKIVVKGAGAISRQKIEEITALFKGKKMAGTQLQECADKITRLYWDKGYITSYSYITKVDTKRGFVVIKVVEGKIGKVIVRGNKYYSTRLLKRRLGVKTGEIFDVNVLKQNLFVINKHPDRRVRLKINLTKKEGVVDIVLLVKDRLPFHVTFDGDNYGSHYIFYRRYRMLFNFNNLTGRDDTLQVKFQIAEANAHKLADIDYRIPLSNDLLFQLYLLPDKREDYYYEREPMNMHKRARKWYFYFYKDLINRPGCTLTANIGFIYMDIFWYAYGHNVRSDRFRIITGGIDLLKKDKKSTTLISHIWEVGIPRMWGGAAGKDPNCSVLGAGGDYKKTELIVARRQKLFADIEYFVKTHLQLASHTLTGVNAFSIGGYFGIIDMRGYPRAQYFGDNGISINTGFSFPPFFISSDAVVPFSKGTRWHDALRLFVFFDCAQAWKKSPKRAYEKASNPLLAVNATDDEGRDTLRSAGFGFTFSIPKKGLSVRVDLGWPLTGKTPMDENHFHKWVRITKVF